MYKNVKRVVTKHRKSRVQNLKKTVYIRIHKLKRLQQHQNKNSKTISRKNKENKDKFPSKIFRSDREFHDRTHQQDPVLSRVRLVDNDSGLNVPYLVR